MQKQNMEAGVLIRYLNYLLNLFIKHLATQKDTHLKLLIKVKREINSRSTDKRFMKPVKSFLVAVKLSNERH